MRILLIQPPFTISRTEGKKCHPPLGLAYLVSVLRRQYDVEVLDALAEGYGLEEAIDRNFIRYGLPFRDIKKKIKQIMPDVVGVSCLFSSQSQNAHAVCELTKEIDGKIITILGGAHPSAVPEEALKDKNVDYAVIGEGEEALSRLLGCLKNEKELLGQDIDGLGFRHNGLIKVNPKDHYEENLDDLPFPYWDIFPLERYFKINNPHGSPARKIPFLPMVTSRGCPFECIFCSVHNLWGKNYRTRSPENILAEIGHLTERFGVKEIIFEDDNLTLNRERAKEIFKGIIDRRLGIVWSVPNGIAMQTLDDEILELMKMSGCYSISIGIESGDRYVLENIIKKPIALTMAKPIINTAKKLGLKISVFFVVGLPGETRPRLMNTFRFAESLNVDNVNFFFATPLPGTRLFQLCKEKRLINNEVNYSSLKSNKPVFATEDFSVSELSNLVSREAIKIHLLYLFRNPLGFMIKLITKIKNEPAYFYRYILQFIKKSDN